MLPVHLLASIRSESCSNVFLKCSEYSVVARVRVCGVDGGTFDGCSVVDSAGSVHFLPSLGRSALLDE